MKLDVKLNEYKNNIESLKAIESLEVYRWLISLGEKLNDDPLSKERRTIKNKVKSCQFELFVDYENGRFKSWSKAMVSAGYAYILIDTEEFQPPFELGIYSFKNLKSGFLKLKLKDKSLITQGVSNPIDDSLINGFEEQLALLLNDIFCVEKDFVEKEV